MQNLKQINYVSCYSNDDGSKLNNTLHFNMLTRSIKPDSL